MGLLDDAIRQHLELKRQHGAPEEELQRQEEEALGPARRDVAPAETAGGDGEVELEGTPDEAPAPDPGAEPHEQATVLQEPEPVVESDSAADSEPFAEEATAGPYDAAADPFEQEDEAPADEALEPAVAAEEPEDELPGHEPLEPAAAEEGSEDELAARDALEPAAPEDEPVGPEALEPPEDAAADLFADEEPEPGHGESSDDVLEDTPDFLQETPEHDRLWFEQKPPRDFDFD
jgi:hypothetical protein